MGGGDERDGLVVQPGDRVHLGFRYTDREGKVRWLTASTKVITHPVFDIMSEDYRMPVTSAYVGETLNLRVVDLGADVSDASDTVNVLMQSKSGAKHSVILRESGPHTGIFKAGYALSYAGAKAAAPVDGEGEDAGYDVRREGFPVVYGDTVAARYTDANGVKTATEMVTISKGADGTIAPFSKKYDDPEIAMRTQFSLAEAYLEMAKRHRKLGENKLAEQEYASAKQLLSKAMDQFTDPETRANAEYLLGTLTMEEADATEDAEMKETRYRAALSRFLNGDRQLCADAPCLEGAVYDRHPLRASRRAGNRGPGICETGLQVSGLRVSSHFDGALGQPFPEDGGSLRGAGQAAAGKGRGRGGQGRVV